MKQGNNWLIVLIAALININIYLYVRNNQNEERARQLLNQPIVTQEANVEAQSDNEKDLYYDKYEIVVTTFLNPSKNIDNGRDIPIVTPKE